MQTLLSPRGQPSYYLAFKRILIDTLSDTRSHEQKSHKSRVNRPSSTEPTVEQATEIFQNSDEIYSDSKPISMLIINLKLSRWRDEGQQNFRD